MSRIVFIVLSLINISCATASEIMIFGADVSLNSSCELSVQTHDHKIKFKPKFKTLGECRLVPHDGTNIAHVKYMNGMYILFIENNNKIGSKCSSEYTSIGLTKDLRLYTTDFIKNSLSCNQGQELQSFKYFSKKLKPYPDQPAAL